MGLNSGGFESTVARFFFLLRSPITERAQSAFPLNGSPRPPVGRRSASCEKKRYLHISSSPQIPGRLLRSPTVRASINWSEEERGQGVGAHAPAACVCVRAPVFEVT